MTTDVPTLASTASALCRSDPPESGRDISRRNALKHGLCARVLTSDEHLQAIAQRRDAWRVGYDLQTVEDEWVFDELVAASVRVDACRKQEPELNFHLARRAELCWDEDRSLTVEQLAVRLPKAPALVVRKLEQTWHGCDLLLGRWFALRDALQAGRGWTEAERSAACDLLGMPAEARDPEIASDRQWAARAVAAEVDRLTALRDGALAELDASERAMAAAGMPLDPPPALRLLRRYQAEAMRRYKWARAQLKRVAGPTPAAAAREATAAGRPRGPKPPNLRSPESRAEPKAPAEPTRVKPLPPPAPLPAPAAAPAPSLSAAVDPPMNRKARRRQAKLQRSGR